MGSKKRARRQAQQGSERRGQARSRQRGGSLSSSRATALLCAVAAALAVLAFANALHNPFVYDDLMTVVTNPAIRDLGRPAAILMHDVFRPVVTLSYAIDFASWELDPWGFHLTSLLLHVLNVVLLFVLGIRLAGDAGGAKPDPLQARLIAFTAAGLLAVHPMMTGAVGYTSARSELLAALFVLIGFLSLRSFLLDGGRPRLVAGLVAFTLGLASKEWAAMLPFLLLTWETLLCDRGDSRRRLLRFHLPLTGFILIAAVGRVAVYLAIEQGGRMLGLWHNALTEAPVIWRYLFLLVVPRNQSLLHPARTITSAVDPIFVAALVGFAGLAALLFIFRRRAPLAVFGAVWFLLLIAPSHVIPLQEAMAEHRVYGAAIGIFLIAGTGLAALARRAAGRGWKPAWAAALVAVPILGCLLALSVVRNRVWADPVTLWSDAAAKAPTTWGAHYSLGEALRAQGRCAEAVPAYRRAVELGPDQVPAYLNLGICLAQTGRPDEARAVFSTARELDPDNPKPCNNLANLAVLSGAHGEARDHCLDALRRDPDNVPARKLLVQLYESVFNDPQRALELCLELRSLAPGSSATEDCIRRNQERLEESTGR